MKLNRIIVAGVAAFSLCAAFVCGSLATRPVTAQEQTHPFHVGTKCRFIPQTAGQPPKIVEVLGNWVRVEDVTQGGILGSGKEQIWINTQQVQMATCPPQ